MYFTLKIYLACVWNTFVNDDGNQGKMTLYIHVDLDEKWYKEGKLIQWLNKI